MANFDVPIVDAPELNIPGEEIEVLTRAWFTVSYIQLNKKINLMFYCPL